MRNGRIELLRFWARISIVAYHFEWLYVGSAKWFIHYYIWVEFFFCLTGFFLAFNATKTSQGDEFSGCKYVWKEFKKLYPLYVVGFLFSVLTSGDSLCVALWKGKWELLLLSVFDFEEGTAIYNKGGAVSYIGAMLFVSLIFYYLIRYKKRLYVSVVSVICVLIGYAYIINNYGTISAWFQYNGVFSAGIIRAAAGMSVGAMAYLIHSLHSGWPAWLKRFIQGMGCMCVVGLTIKGELITYSDVIFMVFVFAIWLVACYEDPLTNKPLLNRFFVFLGKLSYPIFLFHYGIIQVFKRNVLGWPLWQGVLVCLLSTLCLSIFTLVLEKILLNQFRNRKIMKSK